VERAISKEGKITVSFFFSYGVHCKLGNAMYGTMELKRRLAHDPLPLFHINAVINTFSPYPTVKKETISKSPSSFL